MYCIKFESKIDISRAGAKAGNLGKILSSGFFVPEGFIVTRDALKFFLKEAGLFEKIAIFLKNNNQYDHNAREQVFNDLCSEVFKAPVPKVLRKEVFFFAKEFLDSTNIGVAVRSSSIYEDSKKASFAGVYESFLGVSSIDDIWDKIRKCWCSSWSPKAIGYSQKMGTRLEPDAMAVLIQKMVKADSAGVIFTADLLTGNPWRFILNSTFGLGQEIVNGTSPADQFILDWHTGEILDKKIKLSDDKRKIPSLSDEKVKEIGQLALGLDRKFNCRVDIEWAIEKDNIYILQVRPITALPKFFPYELSEQDAKRTWYLSDPRCYQHIKEDDHLVAPLFKHIWDAENWWRAKPEGIDVLRRTCKEQDFNGSRYHTGEMAGFACNYLNDLELRGDFKRFGEICDELENQLNTKESFLRNQWLKGKEQLLKEPWHTLDIISKAKNAAELISVLVEKLKPDPRGHYMAYGAPQSLGWGCEAILKRFLVNIVPDFSLGELLQGLISYAFERTKATQELGRSINEDAVRKIFFQKSLKEIIPFLLENNNDCRFLKDFEKFCWKFGMCPPSWFKRPAKSKWPKRATEWPAVLIIVKNILNGQGKDVSITLENCIEKRKSAEEKIRQIIIKKDKSLLPRFEKLLNWAQFWVPILDDRHWNHCDEFSALYELIWQTGVRLQNEGLIDRPEDVLFFTKDDLEQIGKNSNTGQYKNIYYDRKNEYEKNSRLIPPKYLGVIPALQYKVDVHKQKKGATRKGIVLKGQGFTPGYVTGFLRKTKDISRPEFLSSLTNEDIIAIEEDNCDNRSVLYPILLVAKGLIITGPDSYGRHEVQISRELNVPYVNLSGVNLDRIPDRTKVSVDGNKGIVTVLGK